MTKEWAIISIKIKWLSIEEPETKFEEASFTEIDVEKTRETICSNYLNKIFPDKKIQKSLKRVLEKDS